MQPNTDYGQIIFFDLPNLFVQICETFSKIISWFLYTPSELIKMNADLDLWLWLTDFISTLPAIDAVYNAPLISIMFGSGIFIYFVFALITWILNILP